MLWQGAPGGQGSKCCRPLRYIETSVEDIRPAISTSNLGGQGGPHCGTSALCASFIFQAVDLPLGRSHLRHHLASLGHHLIDEPRQWQLLHGVQELNYVVT